MTEVFASKCKYGIVMAMTILWLWPTEAAADPAPHVISFEVSHTVETSHEFDVAVRAENVRDPAIAGSISISLPDKPVVTVISSSSLHDSNSYVKVFQPGEQVVNFQLNRAIPAEYPLAEIYLNEPWDSGQVVFIILRVVAPSDQTASRVQVRVTLRGQDRRLISYPPSESQTDQQGFPVTTQVVQFLSPSPSPSPVPASTATVGSTLPINTSVAQPTAAAPPSVKNTPATPSSELASSRNSTPFLFPLIAILITSHVFAATAIVLTRLLHL